MTRRRLVTFAALLLVPTVLPAQTRAAKLNDATIVAVYDAVLTRVIEVAQLAAERGANPKVRSFATMLVNEHSLAREQWRSVAANAKVTATPPADDQLQKEHVAMIGKLRTLSGAAFDLAFLQHESDYHNRVIDLVNKSLFVAVGNTGLRARLTKDRPDFTRHAAGLDALAASAKSGR